MDLVVCVNHSSSSSRVWVGECLFQYVPAHPQVVQDKGCHQQRQVGSKTWHQQNPSVPNWRWWLTQVDLYNSRKTVVVVVVFQIGFSKNGNLSAFSALTLLIEQQERHPASKKLSGGVLAWLMVICLKRGADLHMAQLMPLPLNVWPGLSRTKGH